MGPAPATLRQLRFALRVERLVHAPLLVTLDALRLNVRDLARRSEFIQTQFIPAISLPFVHKLNPWKVVHVAVRASNQESRRNRGGRLSLLLAISMNVAATILAIRVEFQLKQTRLNRREQPAVGTQQPAWERRDGHADVGRVIEWIGL